MNPLSEIINHSYENVRMLVEDIGARPAGSPAEQKAFAAILDKLSGWGYETTPIPVQYAPLPSFSVVALLGGVLLILSSILVVVFPWAALATPLLLLGLPQFTRWVIRRRKPTKSSQEWVASQKNNNTHLPELLICAHVDSARAYAFENERWLRLYDSGLYIAQRVAIAAAFVAIFLITGFSVPDMLVVVVGGTGILVGSLWVGMEIYNQAGPIRYSPGAYDNASGVGILLGLAEYFASSPPRKIRLSFLITSAEETGMHGAESYIRVRAHFTRTAVLNLDMVGAGNRLQWVTREGVLFPVKTNPVMNRLISMADDSASGIWYTRRSGDYLPFLQHNIPAASLQTSGHSSAERYYHTVKDGMENIQIHTLDRTIRTVLKFVEMFERFGIKELFTKYNKRHDGNS